jgi:hypothetical protein
MSETVKTAGFCAVAVGLAIAAAVVQPEARTADVFSDQGEVFFPRLTDPLAAKALEVVEYDEATATARPFKVEFRRGRWTIPSHHNYPADAKDRLAKTAAALVDLKRDQVRSDLVEDHGKLGVIDPLDQRVTSLTGRGKRVTLRDEQGQVLADLILGQAAKERAGYRYVRLPGQKRTYTVKTDADPSARFEDWVETDLLKVSPAQIRRVTIHSYSINEQLGRLENAENLVLTREGETWKLAGAEKVNTGRIQGMLGTLSNLRIAGVRPKPPGMTADLKATGGLQMSMETMMSLRQRGFFITPDGRLLANEGEVLVETNDGVVYALRFGEILTGQGEGGQAAPAPESKAAPKAESGENRYLFVTASAAKDATEAGRRQAQALSARFAEWYYVISGADFSKLRLKRRDLVR